jgi:hypothetical protein
MSDGRVDAPFGAVDDLVWVPRRTTGETWSSCMARQEEEREDLLSEATALIHRASFQIAGETSEIFVGFRRDGCGSVYFGTDPAYHFNSRVELRRAYADDRLIKAEDGRLVALRRHRTASAVQLVRQEFDELETQEFCQEAHRRLSWLRDIIAAGRYKLRGQIPPEADIPQRALKWLGSLGGELTVAQSPNAG